MVYEKQQPMATTVCISNSNVDDNGYTAFSWGHEERVCKSSAAE